MRATMQSKSQQPRPFRRAWLLAFAVATLVLAAVGAGHAADENFFNVATLSATGQDFGPVDLGNRVSFDIFVTDKSFFPGDRLIITGATLGQGSEFSVSAAVGQSFSGSLTITV